MSRDHVRLYFASLIRAGMPWGLLIGVSTPLFAQHSTNPVLLVNGFQALCPDTGTSGTFGNLPVLLSQDGAASVDFFDVCTAPDDNIETLAGLLAAKIQSYSGPVDVIAHSMGGLVVRAYLQGRTAGPYFVPPINTNIRKLVLLGTPNFGVSNNFLSLSRFVPWASNQVAEMQFGSSFLWGLGTWNQLRDDLRGVDTLAIAGTAGVDPGSVPWDGVVDVASASLDFADSSGLRSRAVPYCHTSSTIALTCPSGVEGIADVQNRSHLSYQLLRSFLDGNDNFDSIAPRASSVSTTGGIQLSVVDSKGDAYSASQLSSVSLIASGTYPFSNPVAYPPTIWSNNDLPAGANYSVSFDLAGQQFSVPGVSVRSGGFASFTVKFPPEMALVTSSAAMPPGALSVAPGSLISIYGAGLALGSAQASSAAWPTQLQGVSLTLGGAPLQLQYVSPQQINALVPNVAPDVYALALTAPQGAQSIDLMIDPIVPTLFALGGNTAAAIHASSGQVVTSANPAAIGEFISLFGTGLGRTVSVDGLSVAQTTPTVFIGGQSAAVTFGGRAPGFLGLDQINVQIPTGIQPGSSLPVIMSSGNRSSNAVLLAIQ